MSLTPEEKAELAPFLGELASLMIAIGGLSPGQATAGQIYDLRLRTAGAGTTGSFLAAQQGRSVPFKTAVSAFEAEQAALSSILVAFEKYDFNNPQLYTKLSKWLVKAGQTQDKMLENKNVTNELNMQEVDSNAYALEVASGAAFQPAFWWAIPWSTGIQEISNAEKAVNVLWNK
jgi:hypothetical protein